MCVEVTVGQKGSQCCRVRLADLVIGGSHVLEGDRRADKSGDGNDDRQEREGFRRFVDELSGAAFSIPSGSSVWAKALLLRLEGGHLEGRVALTSRRCRSPLAGTATGAVVGAATS